MPEGPEPVRDLSFEAEPSTAEMRPVAGASAERAGSERAESPPAVPAGEPGRFRLLGSASFFRLWVAQVVSSLGDWIGLVAVLSLAARVGGSSPEAAVGIVMSARLIPGFFLGPVGGVLVDRWDRRRVMVVCDVGRGLVLATLPFVETVLGLFLASLLLEMLTLVWQPAKEASVPNLVPMDKLTAANSLSLAAAYGTFPVGSALFASLTKVAEWLGGSTGAFHFLRLNQESLAIYADVVTFFTSAFLISTLALPRRRQRRGSERIDLSRTFTEVKEGWQFIRTSPVIRAVMVGLGTGLIGGGMIAPLGPIFSTKVLHSGAAGFGLLLTALGMGVAVGVVGLSAIQNRLPHEAIFPAAVIGAGVTMAGAASSSSLGLTMAFIAGMGVFAGAVYVVGFTILQKSVEDQLRGRIFAALYTLSRLCLLVSLTLAPLLAGLLDSLSQRFFDGAVEVGGLTVGLPGVRLTLWLGSSIILTAGVLAIRALRAADLSPTAPPPP